MTPSAWTPERWDMLHRLVKEGLTAAKIADAMGGLSRSAVIGAAHRKGLTFKRAGQFESAAQRQAKGLAVKDRPAKVPTVRRAPQYDRGIVALKAKRVAAIKPPTLPKPAPLPPDVKMLRLVDLTSTTCRFPINHPNEPTFGFCGVEGADNPGRPYCPFHTILASGGRP